MARAKKEDVFYTMLKDLAALITETAEEYASIVHGFPETVSRVPQMKVYETTCDERVKAIMEQLYDSFITPFDREDISDLALAMDDVTDAMYGVTMRLDLFNLQDMRIEAEQIADLTLTAVREMQEMIDHLPNYQKDEVVLEKAINVATSRTRVTPYIRPPCGGSSMRTRSSPVGTRSPGCASSTAWSTSSMPATTSPRLCVRWS